MYDERWVVFHVGVYMKVSSYIESYEGVEVYDGREVVFCVVCPDTFI